MSGFLVESDNHNAHLLYIYSYEKYITDYGRNHLIGMATE